MARALEAEAPSNNAVGNSIVDLGENASFRHRVELVIS